MTYTAYSKAQNAAPLTPDAAKDLEYRLLGSVTAALINADETQDVVRRVDSVCWNREVWAALRRDLTLPQNGLPQNLRDKLVDLANWVDRETFRILGGDTNQLDGLIEVNRNIMNGLRPKASPEPAE